MLFLIPGLLAKPLPRLFVDQPLEANSTIDLDADLAHRLHKVLRARVGDELTLFNGKGGEFSSELTLLTKKNAQAKITHFNPVDRESALQVTLIQGISRGNRMDYTIQKSVELGVACIIPIETSRSMVKLDQDRKGNREAHWLGVIKHACEQSQRTKMPTLSAPRPLSEIATLPNIESSYFLDTQSTTPLDASNKPTGPCAIIAGPEGGFSDEERELIRGLGVTAIKLGPRILRTETAAIAALAILQHLWGDLN